MEEKTVLEKIAVVTAIICLIIGIIVAANIGLFILPLQKIDDSKHFYAIDYSLGGAPHITCGPKISCVFETAICTCDTNSIAGYNWIAVEFTGLTKENVDEAKKVICGLP